MSFTVRFKIIPNARHTKVIMRPSGELVCYVTQPAVDGKANEAVRRFLAHAAGIALNAVVITMGAHTRTKLIKFTTDISEQELLQRLGIDNAHQQLSISFDGTKPSQ